jgi:hypothetical protein
MKKQLVASLAAAMVLGIAGTSFAAANPFVDVPAKHWSYDAVTKLASAGIVDGYGDGTFKGDKTISRYEMAQIVAKAMAHSDKATAEQKASIDKLSVEFASELEGLNVRVTKLEKNSSTVKITGEARIRYNNYDFRDNADPNVNDLKLRTRLHMTGNINDQWSYYGRFEAVNNLRGQTGDDTVKMDNVWVKGPILGTVATVGRFDYVPNYGLMFDSTLNGANVAFGNVLQGNVFYGKERNADLYDTAAYGADFGKLTPPKAIPQVTNKLEITGLTLKYGMTKNTNLTGGYYQVKSTDGLAVLVNGNGDDKVKVWEAGFDTKLDSNWSLKGSYGKSDADKEDTAYFAEVGYKGVNKKAGSFGAWANYRNLEANAAPRTTFDGAFAQKSQLNGGKGYEIGFGYAPMNNTVLKVKYVQVKSATDSAVDHKTNYLRAQAEFFF